MPLFPTVFLTLALVRALPATAELAAHSTRSPDGVQIAYVAGGEGAPTLVFVHGWTCDRSYWDAQLPVFAADHRVVAVDLAGHGDSGLGRDSYTMRSFGADVAAAVPGEGPVVLIGHSMGGPVILQAALLLGDRVQGVVAVDTLRDVAPPVTDTDQLAVRVAPLQADYAGTAGQFLASMFVADSDPELQQAITEDMLATDTQVGIDAVRGMLGTDVGAALDALVAPLVIINSTYQPTNIDAVRRHHPQTELQLMEGVGHFVMMEDPDTFNALLRDALASFSR